MRNEVLHRLREAFKARIHDHRMPRATVSIPLASSSYFCQFLPAVYKFDLGVKFGYRRPSPRNKLAEGLFPVCTFQISDRTQLSTIVGDAADDIPWGDTKQNILEKGQAGWQDGGVLSLIISQEVPVTSVQFNSKTEKLSVIFWYQELLYYLPTSKELELRSRFVSKEKRLTPVLKCLVYPGLPSRTRNKKNKVGDRRPKQRKQSMRKIQKRKATEELIYEKDTGENDDRLDGRYWTHTNSHNINKRRRT